MMQMGIRGGFTPYEFVRQEGKVLLPVFLFF